MLLIESQEGIGQSAIYISRSSFPGGGHLGLYVRVHQAVAAWGFVGCPDFCDEVYHCLCAVAGFLSDKGNPMGG